MPTTGSVARFPCPRVCHAGRRGLERKQGCNVNPVDVPWIHAKKGVKMTVTISSDQIAKLPKWAREHIASVERQRDDAMRELRDATSGSLIDPEHQKFCTTQLGGDPFWLPQYGRIAYSSSPEVWDGLPELEVAEARYAPQGIEVRTSQKGLLSVSPASSNVVHIALIKGIN